jgi:peroxiredoxin Q/BCP
MLIIPVVYSLQAAMSSATPVQLISKRAPDFALLDQADRKVSLKDFKGKWLVIAFYPVDMTSGCTLQNRSYTKAMDAIKTIGANVVTISAQDTASKRQFCAKESLTHTLLSDTDGAVINAYRVLRDGGDPAKPIAKRITFYVNPDGRIVAVDTKIKPATAAEDSLAILELLGAKKDEK